MGQGLEREAGEDFDAFLEFAASRSEGGAAQSFVDTHCAVHDAIDAVLRGEVEDRRYRFVGAF
ncbi:hypothetical protein ACFYWN_46375 [Streptomyces sp. NPDC002917]|uniref:hypothetical protein n=1 Tax=Streptomyces sp. NPDC002917 TaxID=3364671 RepID=UPI00369CB16B